MSTSNQKTDPFTSNFTAIFDAASHEYKTLTKQDLESHPFAAAIEDYNSPDAILGVFRKQARAFDKFRKGEDKLMAWLTPIVNILFTFSSILGEGIGLVSLSFGHSFYTSAVLQPTILQPFSPAKTIFTGIGVLLGVSLPRSSLSWSRVTS
jgi:hypothetical protein